jgi:molybdopterin-guanine dinucleotide biosynthesis protein A
MKIDGVILAGGASARMPAHKPLIPFRGATLIEAAIARVKPQVDRLAIDVAPSMTEIYRARLRETVLPDAFAETLGPICGIVTGLMWSNSDWLATFPCDTPFLPHDLVAQLAKHMDKSPIVAKGAQVCGLWPKACLPRLNEGLESGKLRSVLSAVEFLDGAVCEIQAPDNAFFNINTPDDLLEAERLFLLPSP